VSLLDRGTTSPRHEPDHAGFALGANGDRTDAPGSDPHGSGEAGPSRAALPHQPALDGLRGLAVAAVVLFHAADADSIDWMKPWTRGGYLGVSAFFTLSGFLIASLLLEERRSSGVVSIPGFYRRRARRLLPAALLTIAAVVALAPLLATASQLADLPGDAFSSVFYVANWHFIIQGADYSALFAGDPSPLRHVWSLAVEEQWYLLLPFAAVAAAALARRGRLDRRRLCIALGLAVLAGTAWMVFVSGGAWDNRAYMGSDTRLAEMAVGALAAALLSSGFRVRPDLGRLLRRVAPVLLLALLVTWALTPITASWLYRGGLTLHAAVVAVLLVAVVQPSGVVRRLLSLGALTGLGRISYAVYLFHWPILWWASPDRLGMAPTTAFLVQVTATLALAALSLRLLERPIRSGTALRGRVGAAALAFGFATVAALILALPEPDRTEVVALGTGERIAVPTTTTTTPAASPGASTSPTVGSEGTPPTTLPPEPVRVMVVGDSFAESIVIGLQRWGLTTGDAAVMDATIPACAFGRGGVNRGVSIWRKESEECRSRDRMLLQSMAEFDPEVVVVAGGLWDVTDRKPEGFRRWTHIGNPEYDQFLAGELNHLIDLVSGNGRKVLWANSPYWDPVPGSVIFMGQPPYAEADPARADAYNSLLAAVVGSRPEAELLDVTSWMRSQPGGEFDAALRPDGVHFSEASTDQVAGWLGPLLVATIRG
jgi:peptidoglycan/LPS O-acetylase OafA/YrhL